MADHTGSPGSTGNIRETTDSNGYVYAFEDFELRTETCELFRSGRATGLQLKPTRLLLHLIEHRDRTVPKEELLQAIWPHNYVGESSFTTAIGQIRHALDDDGDSQRLIRTFRGRGYRFTGATETPPDPLAFEERDWVLISSFENKTGETLFDDTLELALERTLVDSRYVNVVPRERIQDTLRLMKKPADARVDVSLGREISLRDGAIRAVLAGRAEKLGITYVLSVRIVDPAQGVTVASLSEEAQDEGQIWSAIRRLASGVRANLGEDLSLVRLSESKLAKVTTPSLRALRLYSQADALMFRGDSGTQAPAAELLKRALAEDTEFASAYIHLAWTIFNQGGIKDEYLPYAKTAFELANQLPDRERYYIRGSYYQMLGEYEEAATSYEALLRVYPDHYLALGNLSCCGPVGGTYAQLFRFEERQPYILRRAELRPNSFEANARAAMTLVHWGDGDPAQAESYLQRARALLSPEAEKLHPRFAAWLRLFPAHTHWLQGEVEVALSEVTRVYEIAQARSGSERQILASWVAATFLTLGKLRAAEEIYRTFPDTAIRHHQQAVVAWARGDEPAVMEHMLHVGASLLKALFYARAGRWGEYMKGRPQNADAMAARNLASMPLYIRGNLNILDGELALARGQTATAVQLLEDGVGLLRPTGARFFFWGSASLAQALGQQGEWLRALRVLEEAARQRKVVYHIANDSAGGGLGRAHGPTTLFWLRIQWQRAELLRELGREPEAREIEAELRKLLACADADHDILRKLRDLSQQEGARLTESAEQSIASPGVGPLRR